MVDNPLGRIRLVKGTPPALPGHCVICGGVGDKDSEFLDFGFEIDFYGVVYFCMPCIYEATSVLDLVSKTLYEKVNTELDEANKEIGRLKLENQELYRVLESVSKFGLAKSSNISVIKQSNVVEALSEQSKSTEQDSGKSVTTKSRPAKQINEPRPSSLRNNDRSTKSTKFDL